MGGLDHFYFAGFQTGYVGAAVFLIEAVVLGVVAAWRRSLAETLAGYAGVVLGTVPINILAHYYLATVCRRAIARPRRTRRGSSSTGSRGWPSSRPWRA